MRGLLLLLLSIDLTFGSLVRNIHLVEPIPYMINVITETVHRIEDLQWCNLKVPDVTIDVDEVVFGKEISGTVSYKNGFVVSVRQVDILEHSLGQRWIFNSTENSTIVEITGTLRMNDVTVGFDVETELTDGVTRYTAEVVIELISFDIRVIKDIYTEAIDVTVTPSISRVASRLTFLPTNTITDVYSNLFQISFIAPGAELWSSDYIRPYTLDIVENVIRYPEICYDCPA